MDHSQVLDFFCSSVCVRGDPCSDCVRIDPSVVGTKADEGQYSTAGVDLAVFDPRWEESTTDRSDCRKMTDGATWDEGSDCRKTGDGVVWDEGCPCRKDGALIPRVGDEADSLQPEGTLAVERAILNSELHRWRTAGIDGAKCGYKPAAFEDEVECSRGEEETDREQEQVAVELVQEPERGEGDKKALHTHEHERPWREREGEEQVAAERVQEPERGEGDKKAFHALERERPWREREEEDSAEPGVQAERVDGEEQARLAREREQWRRKRALRQFYKDHGFMGPNLPRRGGCFLWGSSGTYPLHCAAELADARIVSLLLQDGAAVGQRNSAGETAEELARRKNRKGSHDGVLRLLGGGKPKPRLGGA